MTVDQNSRDWHRHDDGETYLCSTNPAYIQTEALNAALGSDMLWWADPLPNEFMDKMINNTLCFGLYAVQPNSAQNSEQSRRMIGFSRVISDQVTVGYLTDVYVLKEFQGKGLAKWMMSCVNEILESWPHMRGFLILTDTTGNVRLYNKTLGAIDLREGDSAGLYVLEKPGPKMKPHP